MKPEFPGSHDPEPSGRVVSVDIVRGLIIALMVFVNDASGIDSLPSWLKHAPPGVDGMTIVDLVFPAFLFIMGMSIPLAVEKRILRGEQWGSIAFHTLVRGLSLIIIGILLLNRANSHVLGGMWKFLMLLAVFATWHSVKGGGRLSMVIRVSGMIALIVITTLFRGEDGHWLHRSWYGILGLIGWAYMIATVVYVVVRSNRTALVGSMALLLCVYCAFREGLLHSRWFGGGIVGSQPAIAVAGVILGTVILDSGMNPRDRIWWTLVFSGFMAAGAWLLRPLYGISKNGATPSWILWSAVFTTLIWVVVYLIVDVRHRGRFLYYVAPAGRNALCAYLLASLVYNILHVTGASGLYFSLNRGSAIVGCVRAAAYAVVISGLAGWMGERGFRLKL